MNIQDIWEKAIKNTRIIRPRSHELATFDNTSVSYVFLSSSLVNLGDTVVRKGEVMVEKPSIVLPYNMPQFDGFDFEKDLHHGQDTVLNFLLVRGVTFPSLKYNNKTQSLDIYEGHIDKAIGYYSDQFQKREDVHKGLVVGPDDCWQFSVLIFIATQIMRSADGDMRKLFERLREDRRGLQ
ncbi:MAG: hypothetical protein WC569_05300 [Candidatus Omnitrophota bacterium]